MFKAEIVQEGIFFVLQWLVSWILLMKKLEIKKTKPTFIFKDLVGLVFSIFNFFINKIHYANNWSKF